MVFKKSKMFAKRIPLNVFKILKKVLNLTYLKKIEISFPIALDNFSLESNFS